MNNKKIVGFSIIGTILAAVIVFMSLLIGFIATIIIFGIVTIIVFLIVYAIKLIENN